jgi:ribosome-associated protein
MRAEQISVVDVGEISPITEIFVFANGTNPRHVKALAQEAEMVLKAVDIRPDSRDGRDQSWWVVLDYGPLMIHVFQPEARTFYDLEMLWGDGKALEWKDGEAETDSA